MAQEAGCPRFEAPETTFTDAMRNLSTAVLERLAAPCTYHRHVSPPGTVLPSAGDHLRETPGFQSVTSLRKPFAA